MLQHIHIPPPIPPPKKNQSSMWMWRDRIMTKRKKSKCELTAARERSSKLPWLPWHKTAMTIKTWNHRNCHDHKNLKGSYIRDGLVELEFFFLDCSSEEPVSPLSLSGEKKAWERLERSYSPIQGSSIAMQARHLMKIQWRLQEPREVEPENWRTKWKFKHSKGEKNSLFQEDI